MNSLKDIRARFLEFFRAREHEVVPSSPLVPRNDPTLLFTNAGMVQFKNVFTGQEKRAIPRATTAQKSVRAGGKHNDLDRVGYTARHHTFFEMLGNFSFGDYFKERAIELAWDLITKDFGLAKDRLLVTVYADDDDAFQLWRKIAGLPESKIIRIATSDNFWSMGEVGPCGPCSEIFYDHGEHIPGGPPGSSDEDGDRFIELWNLVFMQYEQLPGGKREPLPRPSIDTGMGLERITAVMQGVYDNYDIDLFRHLIAASAEHSGTAIAGPHAVSHRVIADHLRSTSFLIADGVLPSNEGRGYVLRRIMRRAMRHAHILGSKDPLMHRLVPTLVAEMGEAYPELKRAEPLITETLKLEEVRFRETLARGLKLLDESTATMKPGDTLAGEVAFKLYDTFGFPRDLTEDALRERGMQVDGAGFDAAMARQKDRSAQSLVRIGRGRHRSALVPVARGIGADRIPGLRHGSRRRRDPGDPEGRPTHRGREGGRDRAHPHQSDAILRRGRRPGRRQRRHVLRPRRGRHRDGYREEARQSACPCRRGHTRRIQARPGGGAARRCRTAPRHARQSFGDASAARRVKACAGSACGAEGLAGGARSIAFRFLPPQGDEFGRAQTRRGRGERNRPPEQRCLHPPDADRAGDRGGRRRHVRRKIWR